MNSVLLEDIIIKGRGFHIPRYPQLILGDGKKYLQGDILDANAVITEIDKSVTKLIDAAPDTLNTLKEIADSLHGDADIAGTLISRITDVENTVADLTQSQSTTIAELTSGLAADITALQTGKVDAVSGKQLSTEDYTTADKNKLAGIEAGAQVNPTNVSAFTNDAGYLTAHQSLAGYATEAWVNNQGFLTEHQDISNKANIADIPTKTSDLTNDSGFLTQHQDISGKANIADLATVATSGSYNDLTDTPDLSSILNGSNFVTEEQLNDIIGINVEGLQELKQILSDDDTTTGILNAIDSKADKTSYQESFADILTALDQKVDKSSMVIDSRIVTANNGYYEYVDLGLPSNTLWAKTNVGAQTETDYGDYFFARDGSTTYNQEPQELTTTPDYSQLQNIVRNYHTRGIDTASATWGYGWTTPTGSQCRELINNTDHEITTINGIRGRKFINRTDSTKYIFIPFAGQISFGSSSGINSGFVVWTSTYGGGHQELGFDTYHTFIGGENSTSVQGSDNFGAEACFTGCSVRPVINADSIIEKHIDLISSLPEYIDKIDELDSIIEDHSNLIDSLQESTDKVDVIDNIIKDADGDLWITKDGVQNPVMHPNLSTQPSLLPQRFGKYPMYEILCPFIEWQVVGGGNFDTSLIPNDATIVEGSIFGEGYCEALNSYRDPETNELYITNIVNEFTPEFALVRYTIMPRNGGNYGYYN